MTLCPAWTRAREGRHLEATYANGNIRVEEAQIVMIQDLTTNDEEPESEHEEELTLAIASACTSIMEMEYKIQMDMVK